MAITSIHDLTQKSSGQSLRVRIIQLWDQPARLRNDPSKKFIIVDEQGDKVQMSLDLTLVDGFVDVLVLSSTVLILNFSVGSFPSRYVVLSYIKKTFVLKEKSLVTTIDLIGFLTRRERIITYDRNGDDKQHLAIELTDPKWRFKSRRK